MYNLNLSKPKFARGVQLRDDAVMPPMADPMPAPLDEPEVSAETPTVQSVTAVQPQMKKFRATICRTVTQSAIVEFEALETQAQYSMSEDLAEQVPADAWTTDPANSWCYIDKLEDLGAASAAIDPAAPDQMLEDDTLNPGDGATDDPNDELLPPAAASKRRRGISRRMSAEELQAQIDDIMATAGAVYDQYDTITDATQAQSAIDTLNQCISNMEALSSEVPDDATSPTEFADYFTEVLATLNEWLQGAESDLATIQAQAA